jgi:hypothetical protein
MRLAIVVVGLLTASSCQRTGGEPDESPYRAKVIGHWTAGQPSTTMAVLDLNPDGTFEYIFKVPGKPDFKLTGLWVVSEEEIFGQVKTAENANTKVGDTFPFGKIVSVNENEMQLKRLVGTDVYKKSKTAGGS